MGERGNIEGERQAAAAQPQDAPTNEPHNTKDYWLAYTVLLEYLEKGGDFDRRPSRAKFRRVLELVAGQNQNNTGGLLRLLEQIGHNPTDNPTRDRARLIMNDIYERGVKDRDLARYSFPE
uniref:Valine--tRNA ligase n=1 Tax=Anthurium amnicola TaxID=1678845 RepID=A0A1D1YU70_9ARAE